MLKTFYFFAVMLLAMVFYMPTIALANSISYTLLKNNNYDVVKDFPPIRVWGTIGFIVAMWITNLSGNKASEFISQGNLVPDAMIIEILLKAVDAESKDAAGFILDGFPRTVEQAIALEKAFEERNNKISFLIDVQVETEELITRLLKRGETSGRSDDNLETIKKRLEIYEEKTAPVNDFYKGLNKYYAINGIGQIEEIFGRISEVIDSTK